MPAMPWSSLNNVIPFALQRPELCLLGPHLNLKNTHKEHTRTWTHTFPPLRVVQRCQRGNWKRQDWTNNYTAKAFLLFMLWTKVWHALFISDLQLEAFFFQSHYKHLSATSLWHGLCEKAVTVNCFYRSISETNPFPYIGVQSCLNDQCTCDLHVCKVGETNIHQIGAGW